MRKGKRIGMLCMYIFTISIFLYTTEIETGYDKGFYLKTTDGKFTLNIKNMYQFLGYYNNFIGTRPSNRSFQINRARLYFNGNAFTPWIRYYLQLQLEKSPFAVRDLYLDLLYFKKIHLRIGQFKVPFDREYLTSSAYLQFISRSTVNDEFRVGRDVGFSLNGNILNKIEYSVGIFNGSGKNSKNLDDNFLYAGRLIFIPNGEFSYSQSSLEFPERRKVAIGVGIIYFPDFEPSKENLDDRAYLASLVRNIKAEKSNIFQVTTDIALKYKGFSFESDFHFRNISPKGENVEGVKAIGFRVQIGYLIFKKLEVAFRYGFLNPSAKEEKDLKYEITGGLNYYFIEHFLKLQISSSYLITQSTVNSIKDTKLQAQLQLYF